MSKDPERFQVRLDGGMAAPEDAKVSVLTAAAMRVHPHRRSTGTPRDTQAL
ncbi:MAG: hypothetical protein OXG62_10265 [Nitrospinae bacterium]|nr:hypothetical protein [Nitrospinota bacterium]